MATVVHSTPSCEVTVLTFTPRYTATILCTGFEACTDTETQFVYLSIPTNLVDTRVEYTVGNGHANDWNQSDQPRISPWRLPATRDPAGVGSVLFNRGCGNSVSLPLQMVVDGIALFEPIRLAISITVETPHTNGETTTEHNNHALLRWSNRVWYEGGLSPFERLTSCRVVGFFAVSLVLILVLCMCLCCKWKPRGRVEYIVRDYKDGDMSDTDVEEQDTTPLVQEKVVIGDDAENDV